MEGIFDLFHDGGHLGHIVNLAVQHGPGLVFQPVGRNNVEVFIVAFLGYDADNAAGADVQRKDAFMLFHRFGGRRLDDIDGLYHFGAQFLDGRFNRFGLLRRAGSCLFRCRRFGGCFYIVSTFLCGRHKKTPHCL